MTLAALTLIGCGDSISGKKTSVIVPPSLLVPCPDPAQLPERDLTDRDVELYWGRDRTALRMCSSQIDGLREMLSDKGRGA